MFFKKIIQLYILCFFGCVYDGNNSKIRFVGDKDYNNSVYTRIRIKDTIYQKYISSNTSPLKFYFLDHIPHPEQTSSGNWKNQKLSILISSDEYLIKSYKDSFEIEKIQDLYSELIFRPNNFHLTNEFEEENIYIFLMFDHLSRYRSFKRSLIGFPLNIELRVSIFNKNRQIAFCQQIVKKNIYTNEFLELELREKESLFYQLKKDNRIDLKSGNLFTDKISLCLEKLKIKNSQ